MFQDADYDDIIKGQSAPAGRQSTDPRPPISKKQAMRARRADKLRSLKSWRNSIRKKKTPEVRQKSYLYRRW
jgi:hypothetical protein